MRNIIQYPTLLQETMKIILPKASFALVKNEKGPSPITASRELTNPPFGLYMIPQMVLVIASEMVKGMKKIVRYISTPLPGRYTSSAMAKAQSICRGTTVNKNLTVLPMAF